MGAGGVGKGEGWTQKTGWTNHFGRRRIRWRVLEVNPKTPGPEASADYYKPHGSLQGKPWVWLGLGRLWGKFGWVFQGFARG